MLAAGPLCHGHIGQGGGGCALRQEVHVQGREPRLEARPAAKSSSRSLRRALLNAIGEIAPCYHCAKRTFKRVACSSRQEERGLKICPQNHDSRSYHAANASLVSTLSWMCLTRHDDGHLSQAPCAHLSSQIFYYDNQTAHLGPSSSPDPTPTSCLEATGVGPGPGPQPAKLSAWGGSQSGPLALFDASAATIVLSPLTEHMSSVMNAGPDGSAAIAVGVGGGVESVPAGHSLETVLFSGSGIRDSYEQWGDALLQFHGKTRTRFDHDVFARARAAEEPRATHRPPFPLPASPPPGPSPARDGAGVGG